MLAWRMPHEWAAAVQPDYRCCRDLAGQYTAGYTPSSIPLGYV
jgi:hypothetical protein